MDFPLSPRPAMRKHLVIPQEDHHAAGLCGRIRPEDHMILAYLPRLAGNSNRAAHPLYRDFTLIALEHLAKELPCAIDPAMSCRGKTEKASKILHRLEEAKALDLIHGRGNRLFFRLAPQFRQIADSRNVKSTEPETSNRRNPIEPEEIEPEEKNHNSNVCLSSTSISKGKATVSKQTDNSEETESEFFTRLQREHPDKDVDGAYQEFLDYVQRKGTSPNRAGFTGWLRRSSPRIQKTAMKGQAFTGLEQDAELQARRMKKGPPNWRKMLLAYYAEDPDIITEIKAAHDWPALIWNLRNQAWSLYDEQRRKQ